MAATASVPIGRRDPCQTRGPWPRRATTGGAVRPAIRLCTASDAWYGPWRTPSSSGLGHHPFKVGTRVRVPLGSRVWAAHSVPSPRGRAFAPRASSFGPERRAEASGDSMRPPRRPARPRPPAGRPPGSRGANRPSGRRRGLGAPARPRAGRSTRFGVESRRAGLARPRGCAAEAIESLQTGRPSSAGRVRATAYNGQGGRPPTRVRARPSVRGPHGRPGGRETTGRAWARRQAALRRRAVCRRRATGMKGRSLEPFARADPHAPRRPRFGCTPPPTRPGGREQPDA